MLLGECVVDAEHFGRVVEDWELGLCSYSKLNSREGIRKVEPKTGRPVSQSCDPDKMARKNKKDDGRDYKVPIDLRNKELRGHRSTQSQLEVDEQKFEHEYIYRSCCLEMDKRVLDFICKMSVIVLVLLFCIYKLLNDNGGEPREIYFSLISSIVTLFIKPPSIGNSRQEASDNNDNNNIN